MSGKTNKSITKRFRFTKNKRLMHRSQHQDHFNAKENGKKKLKKKKFKQLEGSIAKELIRAMKS